ncbi:UNVERIFIED_CONTAM: hypothetical protein RKD43_002894 [Streptomyces graminofaciens]
MASYALIARAVRATGMKVVCRLAAADARTATKSRMPRPEPMIGSASTANTLSEVSGLPRPVPFSPMPAYICTAMATIRYEATMTTMASMAERPGVRALPTLSSLMDRQASQPQ